MYVSVLGWGLDIRVGFWNLSRYAKDRYTEGESTPGSRTILTTDACARV